MEYEFHEVANIFPLLTGDDYVALRDDIAANGLHEPIWLHPDGRIIDGRNRYIACLDAGIEPRFRTWRGDGSLVSFVVSLNLHRRHLTASQRAALAVDVLPMLEKEARKRQGRRSDLPEIIPESYIESRAEAGKLFWVNPRYVQDAKKISQEAPDLLDQVRVGDITLPQAKREMVKRERREAPALPSDKYRVIYADPPWKYGNSGLDDYGHAERHYTVMSISELCDLPVRDIVEDNAVLFMWVTSPLLEECFEVIRAWGFRYKTSFIWDKIKHNYGHYNSVRHELLLVCTRGSCTPDTPKLFDSVQEIERGEHSEKPEEFRNIIDALYTHGRRLELFARRPANGWEVWGNEPV